MVFSAEDKFEGLSLTEALIVCCYEFMAFLKRSFLGMKLVSGRGFPCCEAAFLVKDSICLLLHSCRVFVGDAMLFYGFRIDLEFVLFEFFLVLFIWVGDLQEHSEFSRLRSESVGLNSDFLLLSR